MLRQRREVVTDADVRSRSNFKANDVFGNDGEVCMCVTSNRRNALYNEESRNAPLEIEKRTVYRSKKGNERITTNEKTKCTADVIEETTE